MYCERMMAMIKKIFCICTIFVLIISITGCTKDNMVNNSIKDVQQNESKTSTTPVASSTPVVNRNYNLQEYLNQTDKILLVGKINNNLDIHMELKKTEKEHFEDVSDIDYNNNSGISMVGADVGVVTRYEGIYYYDKYKKDIRIVAQSYSNGYINIFEFDEKNQLSASFGGFIFQNKILKGMWSDKNGVTGHQFYLVKSDIATDGMDLKLDTSRIGSYMREGSTGNNTTKLIIYTVSDDKVKFHIYGYSRPNLGNVGGVASFTDSSKKTAEFYDKESSLKITLEFDGKTIKVVGNDILSQFAGAHVTMSGTFVK